MMHDAMTTAYTRAMKNIAAAVLLSFCLPACMMGELVDEDDVTLSDIEYDADADADFESPRHLGAWDPSAVPSAGTPSPGREIVQAQVMANKLQAEAVVASNVAVTMKHVRYCTRKFLGVCTRSTTPSEFSAWEIHGVKQTRQKDTYLTTLAPSSRSAIENIVFFSAGQQGLDATFTDTTPNVLTGQPDGYRSMCNGTCSSRTVYIDGRSLAVRLMSHPTFARSKTLYVLVFDAQFNFNYGADAKMETENAFNAYIKGLVDTYRIQRIILGGSSRGGALAFRLAHRFLSNNTYPNAKIITEGFDAVFVKNQELGATSTLYDNPLNSGSYRGRYANVYSYFAPYSDRFASEQIVGGQEAVIISGARGVVYRTYDVDYGWWSQRWVDMKHSDIGRDYNSPHTISKAYDHILLSMSRLGM